MPSRQDQLHSYQYSLQRVVAALVTHDPDPHRSPLRRAGTTAVISLVVAALALTAAAIYGIITGGGGARVDDDGVVYLEKGTGARYVFLKSDNKLHPVLNYSSGLLIANASAPRLVNASRKALAAKSLGEPLGIPNAPDSLPEGDGLITDPWSVCTQSPDPATPAKSTLLIGDKLTDGTVAAKPGPGQPAQGLLVSDPDDRIFLVWDNRRFGIPRGRESQTLSVLEWSTKVPWPVAAAWINAIPQGPDLAPPAIDGAGDRADVGVASRVGDVVTDGRQFAVALADGIAAVTGVQAALLQTTRPGSIRVDSFVPLRKSPTRVSDDGDPNGLPPTVPVLASGLTRVCMTVPVNGESGAGVRLNPTVPPSTAVAAADAVPGGVQADFVHVARGKGAVVVAAGSPSAPATAGTVSIVTDTGLRYPLASRELLGKLGYGDITPHQVAAQMIALLPSGPSLDATKARQSHPGT